MPAIQRDAATLHYEVTEPLAPDPAVAEAPAVVFAHGSAGNTLSWWQQVPHFAARHRVVVFDHRGFGRSRCAPDALDPRHFADDLTAVLDAAGVARAAVVCQSMGGWTGLAFALSHPDRTAALVLAGTPGGVATPRVADDAAGVPRRSAERGLLGMALAPGFPARDPRRAHLYAQIASLNPPTTLPAVLPRLAAARVDPARLEGYRVPTLLVAGTEDAFFSVEALREVADAIPGARIEVLAGAGHSAYFEQADAFNRLVESFLREIAACPSSS
jgi:pimeloyl-ACP methyl ester carboxylesterase